MVSKSHARDGDEDYNIQGKLQLIIRNSAKLFQSCFLSALESESDARFTREGKLLQIELCSLGDDK